MGQQPDLVLPAWDQMHIIPGGISAQDLTLNLSGTYTNRGTLAVDNSSPSAPQAASTTAALPLQTGGAVQLFGGGLNNQNGQISAQSLWAELDGDINADQSRITTQGNQVLLAAGSINAQGARFTSAQGDLVLDAQAA